MTEKETRPPSEGVEKEKITPEEKETPTQVEVPPELQDELRIIAQRVGGDFGMEVKVGPLYLEVEGKKVPYTAFYNPEEKSITYNPLFILENLKKAKFIAGHEGTHRAISRTPQELGFPPELEREYYSQIGFSSLQNAIEDPVANDWLKKRCPGLKPYMKETYDQQFQKENTVVYTPEVDIVSKELGYIPKFASFDGEILRFWHKGKFSKKLDPDVEKALKNTLENIKKSFDTVPDPFRRDQEEILAKARERFRVNTKFIWPEVKKLVEKDLHIEEKRQMIEDFLRKKGLLKEKQEELAKAKQKGDKAQQEQLEKDISSLKKDIDPFSKLSSKKRKELQKKIDESIKKLVQEIKEKKGKIRKAEERSSAIPVPMDKLSKKTKKALEELWKSLPPEDKEKFGKGAQKTLENFEDKINKGLKGKLNKEPPPTHAQLRKEEAKKRKGAEQKAREASERKRIQEALEKRRLERMSEYEKARAKEMGLIDDLYFRLRRIFRSEEYGGEEPGYPTGKIPELSRIMQAEKDITQKQKIWIRETAPEVLDLRFLHLIDHSGSMLGQKIEETFKGFVVAGAALDRLEDLNSDTRKVHQAIYGFHDRQFPYKDFKERFSKKIEDKISEMKNHVRDQDAGTDTFIATRNALEELEKNKGKTGNFLLTFTDGEPNYNARDPLKELLKKGREKRERLKIKVGIIWLGGGENQEILEKKVQQLVKEYGYDFGLAMPAVEPNPEEARRGQKNFSENLAELLEDLAKHPGKY